MIMKGFKQLISLSSLLLATALSAQVPEIADEQLNDIAIVKPHPEYGAVIIYNPSICQQIGAACGFFRAHEYGHIALNHQYLHPSAYPAQREAEADRWAASNGIPQEILAAYYLFLNGGSSGDWQTYGNPQQRAQRLRLYAIDAGKWIGP
tara:strand:+ start:65290 stop:65739 length:450 start_codon:yes stop_codon:yes gene_type:complete